MSTIFNLLLFIYIFSIGDKLINVLLLYKRKQPHTYRLQHKIVTVEDLHALTPYEFSLWVSHYLKRSGYTILQEPSQNSDEGKDLICERDGETVYVECRRQAAAVDTYFRFGPYMAKKLAGAMFHDGVGKGIIFTTGRAEEEVHDFLDALPTSIKIDVMDAHRLEMICQKLYSEPQHTEWEAV